MTDKASTFVLLKQLSLALHKLFAPFCEVVIHDFSDLEHSIVHLDGNVTNRSLGGGATDLLLKHASHGDTDQDLYNYLTTLPGGRVMKSSTIFLRDQDGSAYGAFCINFEISAFSGFHKHLTDFLNTEDQGEVTELLSDDIQKTIQSIIAETVSELENDLPILSRDDKVDLIARLDAKGIFQVKRAVPILADQLGLSRATVYNYLSEARDGQKG